MTMNLFPAALEIRADAAELQPHERSRYRPAAGHARRVYPGPLGELAYRELIAYAEFGYRFSDGGSPAISRFSSGGSLRGSPPERIDRFLVWRLLGDCVHVPGEEVHIGLEHIGEFPGLVRLDQHESRSATGQVVPASNPLRMVCAGVVLLEYAAPQRLGGGLWVPLEFAVPQHVVISDFGGGAALRWCVG